MSWFSSGGALDEQIERATSESLPSGEIDLALNLEICDLIRSKTVPAKDAMRSLKKRLNHKNPNVLLLTLKLTDVCVKNGGYHFLVEIASREFMDNLVSLLKSPLGINNDVKIEILQLIQTWASVFDGQIQLGYVGTVYKDLKNQGFEFPEQTTKVSSTFIDSSAPPDWTDSEVCMRCRTPFSFTNRKHHCRNCGNAVDQNCSSKSIPLPHLGITVPVRVCDTCYALKHVSHSKHHRHKSEDKRKGIANEDDDLQLALKMSLEDSKGAALGYTARAQAPVAPKPAPAAEYEDPDMKAAIEASLRDLEEQKKKPEPAPVQTSSYAPPPPAKAAPSPNQLSLKDIENINLFSILVDHLPNENPGAILRDPKLQELYDHVTGLRPKFSRNVVESIAKYDALVEMYQKLSTAMRYYDQMLEARLGYATYGRRHWVDKNCVEWSKTYFTDKLVGTSAASDTISAKITKLASLTGDVDVNQRKGKVISLFDVRIVLDFEGSVDGEDVKGTITVPEVAYDTDEDEYVFEVAVTGETREKMPIRPFIRDKLVPELRAKLAAFGDDLITTHAGDIQHPVTENKSKYTASIQVSQSVPRSAAKSTAKSTTTGTAAYNTTTISLDTVFNTPAAELYTTFLDAGRVTAWTRSPPVKFEPKEGGEFALFGGNVSGKFIKLEENKSIEQSWRLKDWKPEHYANLKIVFDQGQGETKALVTFKGVPVGQEDVTRHNFEEYYVKSIKLTFGFGAVL